MFLTYTVAMNGVTGAIAVAAAAAHFQNDCEKRLHVWLLVEALVGCPRPAIPVRAFRFSTAECSRQRRLAGCRAPTSPSRGMR